MLHEEQRYAPKYGAKSALALAKTCPFAVMISYEGLPEPIISHIPVLADGEDRITALRAHVSRANMHADALLDGSRVLVVFQGPNAYISPTWYSEPTKRAPTWNYAVVHVFGHVRVMRDVGEIDCMLDGIAAWGEAAIPKPWEPGSYDDEIRTRLRRAILGAHITVDRVETKFKLNQHNSIRDRTSAADGLASTRKDNAVAVANMMRETLE